MSFINHGDRTNEFLKKLESENIINLYGEEGVGKTVFLIDVAIWIATHQLFNNAQVKYFSLIEFDDIFRLELSLKSDIVNNPNEYILILDDVTKDAYEKCKDILKEHLKDSQCTKVILVSDISLDSHVCSYELKKADGEGYRNIFHGDMEVEYEEDTISKVCELVEYNPRKIAFLRDLKVSSEEIIAIAEDLGAKSNADSHFCYSKEKLMDLFRKCGYGFLHIMSIGLLRKNRFDESLLSHLWDCLGLGNSSFYSKSLDFFLSQNIIRRDHSGASKSLVVNRHIQVVLLELLKIYFSKSYMVFKQINDRKIVNALDGYNKLNRLKIINYYIAKYYAQLYISQEDGVENHVDSLIEFIHYSICIGDIGGIYNFLKQNLIFEKITKSNRYDLIIPYLYRVNKYIDTHILTDEKKIKKEIEKVVSFKLDMSKSLIESTQKINPKDIVKKASELIDRYISTDRKDGFLRGLHEVEARIGFMQGKYQSYVDVDGKSKSEVQIVNVIEEKFEKSQEIDSEYLGYFSLVAKFENYEKAIEYGHKAVDLTPRYVSLEGQTKLNPIYLRNLCNLAQNYFFYGNMSKAEEYFEKAYECSEAVCNEYPREHARIACHYSLLYIHKGQYKGSYFNASNFLKTATEFNKDNPCIDFYNSIIQYRKAQNDEAETMLKKAIHKFRKFSDTYYLCLAAFTFYYFQHKGVSRDLSLEDMKKSLTSSGLDHETIDYLLKSNEISIYFSFWKSRFVPYVLTCETN